jgi:hypothetical protein
VCRETTLAVKIGITKEPLRVDAVIPGDSTPQLIKSNPGEKSCGKNCVDSKIKSLQRWAMGR